MKKRILGLLMALCLVVGLLPMAALADDEPTVTAEIRILTGDVFTVSPADEPVCYAIDEEGKLVVDDKATNPVIAIDYKDGGYEVVFTDATLDLPTGGTPVFRIITDAKLTIVLNGTNNFSNLDVKTAEACLNLQAAGGTTITGTGTLNATNNGFTSGGASNNPRQGSVIESYYDLTIKDVTLNLKQEGPSNGYGAHGIRCAGNLVIDGANINIDAAVSRGIYLATGRSTVDTTGKTVTIQNGAKVNVTSKSYPIQVGTDGQIIIDETNGTEVTLKNCDGSTGRVFSKTPILKGSYNAVSALTNKEADATAYTLPENSAIGTKDETPEFWIQFFKLTHKHNVVSDNDCTTDDVCTGCGEIATAKLPAHVGTSTDCAVDTLCTNPGCTKVAVAATTHTPAADDGDCTTAINCTVCGKETTPAAEHTYTRTDCSVDSICTVCNKVAVAAGAHTGGTATCKDKAVCTVCKQAYGELGSCVPAADDGDCTTAINCSICGKETTAAKTAHTGGAATCKDKAVCTVCNKAYGELSTTHTPATDDGDCSTAVKCTVCQAEVVAAKAHAFTDAQDTACDNAGCTHTRVVKPDNDTDSGNSNPSTGDISIVLTAAIALSSAVGFAGVTVLRKKKG